MGLLRKMIREKDHDEPFTDRQKKTLTKRDRNFIRTMQIHNSQKGKPSDLQSTIKDFHNYRRASRKQKNKIRASVQKSIEPFADTQLSRKTVHNIVSFNQKVARQNRIKDKGLPEKPLSKKAQKELKQETKKLLDNVEIPRFLRIKGTAGRYWDTQSGKEISRRQHDKIVKSEKKE